LGRLDVFVDETALVQLAESYSNPTAKELFQFEGPAKKLIEGLSIRILKQQLGPALALCKGDPSNPCWIELVSKREFVLYLLDGC
jgi:hypothetical protein